MQLAGRICVVADAIGWDVSLDGKHFLMLQSAEPEGLIGQAQITFEWFEEIEPPSPGGQVIAYQ